MTLKHMPAEREDKATYRRSDKSVAHQLLAVRPLLGVVHKASAEIMITHRDLYTLHDQWYLDTKWCASLDIDAGSDGSSFETHTA